ncbi:MAG: hypothetical protein LAN71_15925 [Acidobacteriia bacterium]|nr:hypothetical protein [Terriglobia bacterium]
MADESAEVLMRVENDARLIAGVAAGAACCGATGGLGEEEVAALRGAVRAACEYAFGAAPAAGVLLEVGVARSVSRLEVTLSRPGTAAGAAAPLPALAGVDQVQRETRGDNAVLILTKLIKPPVSAE